jgi:hypothetical protein
LGMGAMAGGMGHLAHPSPAIRKLDLSRSGFR